jgi:hypothetical protein
MSSTTHGHWKIFLIGEFKAPNHIFSFRATRNQLWPSECGQITKEDAAGGLEPFVVRKNEVSFKTLPQVLNGRRLINFARARPASAERQCRSRSDALPDELSTR